MKVRTACVGVTRALLSRTVLRNLVLLAAMGYVLAALPFRSVWASEIILNIPCAALEYTPAGARGVGASCTGESLCYSAMSGTVSIITSKMTMAAFCYQQGVFNEADVGASSSMHINSGLATAFSSGLPVSTYWEGLGCDGYVPLKIESKTFWNCALEPPSYESGSGWLGGGGPNWGSMGGGCTYCSYNWMVSAQCSGPTDTHCSIFMMQ
jgi:hypothetical protein